MTSFSERNGFILFVLSVIGIVIILVGIARYTGGSMDINENAALAANIASLAGI